MGNLRDAAQLLAPAVETTLTALDSGDQDAAAVKLAQQYARVIDSADGHCHGCADPVECSRAFTSAWAMRWLGPLLLDALESLGATPAARARLTKGSKPADGKPNRLAQLRSTRGA